MMFFPSNQGSKVLSGHEISLEHYEIVGSISRLNQPEILSYCNRSFLFKAFDLTKKSWFQLWFKQTSCYDIDLPYP